MKAKYLFPPVCRVIGWVLAIPGFLLGIPVVYNDYAIPGFELRVRDNTTLFKPEIENFTNELALTLFIAGLVLVAFSRLRKEDELTGKLRLNALYWAILINLIIAMGVSCFMWLVELSGSVVLARAMEPLKDNLSFYVYNLFMPLVIFITRFYYLLYRSRDEYQLKPLHFLPFKPYNIIGKVLSLAMLVAALTGAITNMDKFANFFYFLPLPLLLWAYTRERQEDEYINSIRLDAMQLAVYVNYAVLLISNWLFYGIDFLAVLIVNLSTIPLIFITVFHFRLTRLRSQKADKELLMLI